VTAPERPAGARPRAAPQRYLVRNAAGKELVCPSLADLSALYAQGFLEDGDLVRPERSQRWVRAGDLPALHGTRLRRQDPRKVATILAAAAALVIAVSLLARSFLGR
jgi:hypothetical protein